MELRFSGDYCLNEENASFEAKSTKGGIPLSMWESYSSFANSFGGTIVLGLEETEDGVFVVKGVKDAEKAVNEIWNTINNPQKISSNILKSDDVKIVEYDGKRLITVNVPRADRHDCPIYINDRMNGGTFRRNGPNDYRCTKPEIAEMMRENVDTPLDAYVLNDYEMNDIDSETLSRYRIFMKIGDEKHIWNTVPDDEFLRLIGAAKKGEDGKMHPTLAGLLMFGLEFRITSEVPNYKLDYIEYMKPGVEWEYRIVSGDGQWTGNIFDFYMNVANRLGVSTGRPFMIGSDWRMVKDNDVDKALRELTINALIHADYRGRMGVRIEVRPNAVTARNPGLFRIPIQEATEGGYSDPRNPTIAKMFSLLGAMERSGSGLYRIMETWKKYGLEAPLIEEALNPPTVRIVLSLSADPKASVMSEEEKILMLMAADENISIDRISKETDISRSRVEAVVKRLKDNGKLERAGGKKGGYWIVK